MDTGLDARLVEKRRRREADEAEKPLASYRSEELARMRLNFYGFDPSYHVARYNFIHESAEVAHALDVGSAPLAPRGGWRSASTRGGSHDARIALTR